MAQAHRDLEAGQVDTDLHGTPGVDAEQRERDTAADARRIAQEAQRQQDA